MANDLRDAIFRASQELGINPLDLGTAISYETAGSFDPMKAGPTTQWGQHRGLIQWGQPQAQKYLGGDFSIPSQERGIVAYLRDAGVQPGMGMLDVYSAINAGKVDRYNASDANNGGAPGNVRDKVTLQMGPHRAKAAQLLGLNPGDPAPALPPPTQIGDRPVAEAGTQPAPQQVQPQQPASPLGNLFAAMAPAANSAPQIEMPRISNGSGDPMGATMAAAQMADKARGLSAGLAPNIDALMSLGKRPGGPAVLG